MTNAPTSSGPSFDRALVPTPELQLRRRREALLRDNLVSIFARRCANCAHTALVYAGAALAAVLLLASAPVASARDQQRGGGLLGLVVLVALVLGALVYEEHLVTVEWPRLLLGGAP